MNDQQRAHHIEAVTDFRYRLVAELTNPYVSPAERKRLIREKASVEYDVPGLGRRRFTQSCIKKWLTRYRAHGKEGLKPRNRKDSGVSRALNPGEAALLLNHLQANPELTATAVLFKLQRTGIIRSTPSESSLSRLVRSAGLDRLQRLKTQTEEKSLKFEFSAPLECVQVDGLYSVKIPDAHGIQRYALLLAFLDDATRRVLFASFSFSENCLAFEAGIKHILSAHGRIGRIYCDNGAAFVSDQTQRILDSLGIILIHSRPGIPRGRGKVERYFRTAREQFFAPLDLTKLSGIEELDRCFHAWLESEYHRSPHRGLGGKTPLDAWVEKAHLIVPLEPTLDLSQAFLHEASRKVHKDSTVTLDGALFEVPSTLAGERIIVRYDPHLPPQKRRLQIIQGAQLIGEARLVDSYANSKVRRGDINRQLEITDTLRAQDPPGSPARRPVDNSLSASRLHWHGEKPDDDDAPSTDAAPTEVTR